MITKTLNQPWVAMRPKMQTSATCQFLTVSVFGVATIG